MASWITVLAFGIPPLLDFSLNLTFDGNAEMNLVTPFCLNKE